MGMICLWLWTTGSPYLGISAVRLVCWELWHHRAECEHISMPMWTYWWHQGSSVCVAQGRARFPHVINLIFVYGFPSDCIQFYKMYLCIFKIQNTYLYLKYISLTSIYILYLNTFSDPVSVFCIKIHFNVFSPISGDRPLLSERLTISKANKIFKVFLILHFSYRGQVQYNVLRHICLISQGSP